MSKDKHLDKKSSFKSSSKNIKRSKTVGPGGGGNLALPPIDDILFQPIVITINQRRDRIVDEFVRTEQTYVRSLTVLITHFQIPMTEAASKIGLSADNIKTLFGDVGGLASLNLKLLQDLAKKILAWSDTQTIGDVLKMMTPFLTLYTTYSINFEKANNLLNDLLERKESFKDFVEFQQAKPECGGLLFGAYLIMPIQRIPRYRMLLEDLIKNTEDNHPDKAALQSAFNDLLVVAQKVNQAVTQQENSEKLLKIAKKFIDYKELDIFKPGRSYIMEGEMAKVCRKEAKRRTFFLFSDLFLYAYPQNNKYKIGRQFDLHHCSVKDLTDQPSRGLIYGIQIKSEQKSFNVLCPTPEDKVKWLKAFNDTLEILHQKATSLKNKENEAGKGEAPVWVQDSEVKACACCAIKFTFTNRRHHCRQCGCVVCGSCSGSKKYLEGQGKQRVCDECAKKTDDHDTHDHSNPQSKVQFAEEDSVSSEGSEASDTPVLYQLEALFDYVPPNANNKKLALKTGDRVSVLYADPGGWFLGEVRGERGWVPSPFLEAPPESA